MILSFLIQVRTGGQIKRVLLVGDCQSSVQLHGCTVNDIYFKRAAVEMW